MVDWLHLVVAGQGFESRQLLSIAIGIGVDSEIISIPIPTPTPKIRSGNRRDLHSGGGSDMANASIAYYRLFDHTADLGMEIFGADPAELFANAGSALFNVMVLVKERKDRDSHTQTLSVEGYDWADLMVNWLRELLYLWHGRQEIPLQIRIEAIGETALEATVTTCDFLPLEHQVQKEIKAVTYHQIAVGPHSDGGWKARVIFDV
jgi:SHS2 domain-containing protein